MQSGIANSVLVFLFCIGCGSAPGEPTRVYLAPDDHTDYFWSAGEETYRQAFLATLDYYLNLADATASNPADHQSRWNCDGSFWLWTYEKNRTPAEFMRLIDRIAGGHISVPLNPLCVCLGGAPMEAVLRGMYYPGQIERRTGVRFPLAYTMENQTQPFGLSSLWAGCGAKYSWKGICACDTRVPTAGDREHDIYRSIGPDGNGVLMKWNSLLASNQAMGGYAEARDPFAIVDFVTTNASSNGFAARYPYDIIGCFGKGWDDIQTQTDEFITAAMMKTTVDRRVIVSNEEDFFRDFDAAHGAALPTHACSFGNEWELYAATMAETSARIKRAVEKLRAAEALAAVVTLRVPSFMNGREAQRDQAWMDLGLFWEHNFGMAGFAATDARVIERIAWQNRLPDEVDAYVGGLHADAAGALADLIPSGVGAPRFFVFNPLSWPRDDHVDLPYDGSDQIDVADVETNSSVPFQIAQVDRVRVLRVWCQGVPSVGYRVYEIRDGVGPSFAPAATVDATVDGGVLESAAHRITIADRGAITGLVDKTAGREFAQTIDGRSINDLGGSTGTVAVESAGPVSVTVVAAGPSPVSHTSAVTVFRGHDRIEIDNRIDQAFGTTESWAFTFNLSSPDVRHEEVGAIARAKLLGDGGDYSPRNARYDWLTLNHFASMTGSDGASAVLSNADAYFMNLGDSTVGTLDTSKPRMAVLAGGRVVGSFGIPNQAGMAPLRQRFALRTYPGGSAAAEGMRFALEHQNPLVARIITGVTPSLPATHSSFLSVEPGQMILWALKPADDGPEGSLVARVWNVSDTAGTATLNTSFELSGASVATHIETDLGDQPITTTGIEASFLRQQVRSFRLLPGPRLCDLNRDRDVDLKDYGQFVPCMAGPATAPPSGCAAADVEQDGHVDLRDQAVFARRLLHP